MFIFKKYLLNKYVSKKSLLKNINNIGKRFLSTNIQEHNFDALVIGAGGAGLKSYNGASRKRL